MGQGCRFAFSLSQEHVYFLLIYSVPLVCSTSQEQSDFGLHAPRFPLPLLEILASFGSPGNFLIQIPFNSNSECVLLGPWPAVLIKQRSQEWEGHTQGTPGVSFGNRCCHRPLLYARIPITSHMGAFTQGLHRQSPTSGSILDLSHW